ncbi:MAG: phosphopentomutase [Opitutales bacterium]|nr:phosphopentomutase [Opitutales bacterium]
MVIVVVIDSFGMGASADAEQYGDVGAHTARSAACGGPEGRAVWPTLRDGGLGNAAALRGDSLPGVPLVDRPRARFGLMVGASPGKDTVTGHWELAGVVLKQPLAIFPPECPSFPRDLIDAFSGEFGTGVLGNHAASGTEVIASLGEEHVRKNWPIFYTSADSVIQIAAHEAVVPVERLYAYCQWVRAYCDRKGIAAGRVIARPFEGVPGDFRRTSRRKDFSMAMPERGLLPRLNDVGVRTVGVGKIGDIFNHCGLTEDYPGKGNPACLDRLKRLAKENAEERSLLFVNLVDTDMVFGHRRDPQGYHNAVAQVDGVLWEIAESLKGNDVLIVTADHGCDPGFRGSDHTREDVPLLAYSRHCRGTGLGIRSSFADLAQSLAAHFGAEQLPVGEAFPLRDGASP